MVSCLRYSAVSPSPKNAKARATRPTGNRDGKTGQVNSGKDPTLTNPSMGHPKRQKLEPGAPGVHVRQLLATPCLDTIFAAKRVPNELGSEVVASMEHKGTFDWLKFFGIPRRSF
jgi:hypothetical protein